MTQRELTDRLDDLDRKVNEAIGLITGYRQPLEMNLEALGLLVDRIEHADLLARRLSDLDPVLLTGELSAARRARAMAKVREGARLTVATVHLMGEGVDVPGWDLLFLASPISGGPRTLQAVGRVARPAPGKTRALVVDFVDSRTPALAAAWRARRRLYAA
jgi:superfamily II DNA or RNA helicase